MNFTKGIWDAVAKEVVFKGNLAKFSQHQDSFIISTEKEMPTEHVMTRKPYDNCILEDKDGDFLSRCDRRRIGSYLRRGLADVVNKDPLTIKLRHVKKNFTTDPYLLEEKLNQCVVCGKEEDLTKHHVIPSCYKVHFPEAKKNFNHHDVLIVCVDCHRLYENAAIEMRESVNNAAIAKKPLISESVANKRLAAAASKILSYRPLSTEEEASAEADIRKFLGLPDSEPLTRKTLNLILKRKSVPGSLAAKAKAAAGLIKRRGMAKSGPYLDSLKKFISEKLGHEPDKEDLEGLSRRGMDPNGSTSADYFKAVVACYGEQEFAEAWRRHFVETMKPRFMPNGWSLNKPLGAYASS